MQPGGKWITETRTDYVNRDAFHFWLLNRRKVLLLDNYEFRRNDRQNRKAGTETGRQTDR